MTGESNEATSYTSYVTARWSTFYRFAHLLTADPHEADDVLQATLVKAYLKWDRVSTAESIDAYVRRMLVNELLGDRRLRRRRSEHRPLPLAPADESGSDPIDRIDLWQHLAMLPTRQRAVLVLRYYEDLSEQQTATVLGCSRGTVKSQTHDALRALRVRLQTDEELFS